MLTSLHIENIAVVRNCDIDFSDGFTALTGETGAGKSVIIDSIGLLLGARSEKELVRTGTAAALVSGLFSSLSDRTKDRLAAAGVTPDENGELFIQRTLTDAGKTTVKIGGRTVPLSLLREIAPALLGIHGQNDTRALTDARTHLELIDRYARLESDFASYLAVYNEYDALSKEIRDVTAKERDRARLVEIDRYQIADIDAANFHDGEEEELVEKRAKIRAAAKIIKNATFVYKALRGVEKGNAYYLIDRSAAALEQLSDVIPSCKEHADRLREALFSVADVAEEALAITEDAPENPDTALGEIEERLDLLNKLKRKYGLTVAEILAFREKCAKELEELTDTESVLKKLTEKRDAAYQKALSLADILHGKRKAASAEIETKVKEVLEFLDMPKTVFYTDLSFVSENGEKVLTPVGYDRAEFFISPNRGADPQPLAKIASGGELARIMLALKTVLSDADGVETLIFDEIDAGVSGKTARKIGIRMLTLSRGVQVFCVTHSAQIASLADTHLLIRKDDKNGATETSVSALSEEGRIAELSRILGGIEVTEAQRAAAVDMRREKENYLS